MEKIERFIVEPNLRPVFGQTITKDTNIDVWTEDKKVHQTIKNLTLTTKVNDKIKSDDLEITEESKMTVKMPENTRLLWTEAEGYIIPKQKLMKRTEINEELKNLDGIEGLE